MCQQKAGEVGHLVRSLEAAKGGKKGGGKKKGFSCKKSTFPVAGSEITVDSWRFQDWDYKRDDLPTYARGLFTSQKQNGDWEIVIRGYDKFFNVDEVKNTQWDNVETNTQGPYELSVKENGCIIFVSGLEDGTLLVCSKHSTGAREDVDLSHAVAGERWVKKHLAAVGKTATDLAKELRRLNVTAVAELCDDEFEEHVLEYPPQMAGLYLHGVNFNLPEFATWSGPEVHQFADAWGMKRAEYVIIHHLDEVKTFLAKCAETGSWSGRDTEGFVIRCKLQDKKGQPYVDWFFKYKFEEPYLMYRQWREATKSIIAGKPPRFKKHKQITEEYLLYARKRLAREPKLAKNYNKNHGIISMRDGFLAEKGQKGSDIIAQEQAEGGELDSSGGTRNIVLVPVASIGCGKTTVALALVNLFRWGHVQNDNIEGKGNRPKRFALQITNLLSDHPAVIADRNNHQKRERRQIIEDIGTVIPDALFVALHYVHTPKDRLLPEIRKVTRKRVLDRGDNHQTIRAESKSNDEILGIMEGFLGRFEGVDTNHEPDCNFDEVIDLDVAASSVENLEKVVTRLYNAYPKLFRGDMPSSQDMQDAIDHAMDEYTVDLKHNLDFSGRNNPGQKGNQRAHSPADRGNAGPQTPEHLVKRIEYFSITLSYTVINSMVSSLFSGANKKSEEARFYNHLKQTKRIQDAFHVTLIHRASAKEHQDIWDRYTDLYTKADPNLATLTPSLGPARVRLERLVWDDRVMCIVVRLLPPEKHESADGSEVWPCANEVAHITIGTAAADVKPKESNDLLKRWLDDEADKTGIFEKEVPGVKILDGTVKAVMQRGRG